MSETDFKPMVAKGAELLDERRPGWAEDIDLELLDMTSGWHCVLGQLYGDYYDGLEHMDPDLRYRITDFSGRDHGFTLNMWGTNDDDEDWYRLHELWRQEVVARVGP